MKKRILLVDDAAFMRLMLKDILEKNNYEVVGEAANGAIAVEKYKELNPDLIVLNITMPTMDGIEALRTIRIYDPNARAMMCSALGFAAVVCESLLAGAKRFTVKPFQPDTFLDHVKFILQEENPTPLNQAVLTTMHQAAKNNEHHKLPGSAILSQAKIDNITALAEKPDATTQEVEALMQCIFMFQHDQPPTDVSFSAIHALFENKPDADMVTVPSHIIAGLNNLITKQSSPDPILNALDKLADGQEKMTALLEKLVAKQEEK